jgi:chromosome segregation protein
MFLKSLELEGFKSFVDSTHLFFNDGFTAIVGPNGCGKSNVSDAIRWVIGEQSSKSLRGTKTTDLIFNGSGSRKPVNRVEISLTLTKVPNRIRIASIPNLSEEVRITRCYHRSGESEFYINQVPCRLKDITDFLLDIGISPKVLTVIEQGHIQDIITSKPEDRRILIEEAAGILKFKHRRNEAIRKLEASGQNLERISDIVQELHRQAESLKRQAAKAERYKNFQAEIKDLSLKLFSKKTRHYKTELEEVETIYNAQTEQKASQAARFSQLENQVTELNIEIDDLSSGLSEKKEQVHQLSARISKDEHGIELKQSEIAQAERETKTAGDETLRMNAEIKGLLNEAEAGRLELGNVSNEINEQEKILNQGIEAQSREKIAQQELENKVRTEEENVLSLFHRISQKKNEATAHLTRKQFLASRNEQLEREHGETLAKADQSRESLIKEETLHQNNLKEHVSLKEQKEILERETRELKEQLREKIDASTVLKEKFLKQSSLLSSLEELRGKFEGFHEGVKSLMSDSANGNRLPGLREVLVDVLKAPKEYEVAVEAVLGGKLQSIIVNSYSDTVGAIDCLKDRQAGRGSFIPLHPKAASHPPLGLNGNDAVMGKVVDVVECEDEYRPVIELLLGNVVMVKDLDTAFKMHENANFQGVAVTLTGEMVDSQGLITGGSAQKNTSGLLARNREIETLNISVDELKEQTQSAEISIDHLENTLKERNEHLERIEKSVHEKEIVNSSRQKDMEQLQNEVERLEEKKSSLDYEKTNASHELLEVTEQHDKLEEETVLEENERIKLEEQAILSRRDLQQKREELELKSAEINTVKVRIASLIGKRENTLTEIKRLDLQQENHRHKIQKLADTQKNNSARVVEIQAEVASLEKQILQQAREKDRLSEELVQEEETLNEKDESLDQMEKEAKSLSRQIQELTESISKVELKRSELKIQTTHLEEKAYDDFNATREEMMRAYDETIDVEEVDGRVAELKGKVAKMGEVNLAALSDYQETHERYSFLSRQQEDLLESINMLHNTIEKINRTTKQRFLETFEQVNQNFQETFARLFQGGKATLSLTDEANPLESGIEITANPLGKNMQNLSLMSGGEKSMTAIALIFAVFKVRPSPFCLLDEVDAPLDEANVVRFQEMLKEMSLNTQFILITHNQKTMSFADVLYGITMEEGGVSKAVSVRMN